MQDVQTVLRYLKENRGTCSVTTLTQLLGHPPPIEELKQHRHIITSNQGELVFVYRPTVVIKYRINITNATELRDFCLSRPRGALAVDLQDAYKNAPQDLAKLLKEQVLVQFGTGENAVIFPAYGGLAGEPIDPRIKEMWHAVKMPPSSGALEEELKSMGHETFDRRGAVAVSASAGVKRKRPLKVKVPQAGLGSTPTNPSGSDSNTRVKR